MDEKQNENDFRPPENGSYIYSEIVEVSPAHEIGIGLAFGRKLIKEEWGTGRGTDLYWDVRAGISIGYWNMEFAKGWNRFASDQTSIQSEASGYSIYPHIDVMYGGSKYFGSAGVGYRIINLDYEADILDDETAKGWEVGITLGLRF